MKTKLLPLVFLFTFLPLFVYSQTNTTPETYFADISRTYTTLGQSTVQQFTISATTNFVIRFVCQYAADAAIFVPSQLSNFQNNAGFTGYGLFDNVFGTKYITLAAGTYYLGMRNQVNTSNPCRVELDLRITLPSSDQCVYTDAPLSYALVVNPGQKLTYSFTYQHQYRYFIDGCNSSSLEVHTIPASQIAPFINGQTFYHYTDYSGTDGAYPGFWEYLLPDGNYALAIYNPSSTYQSITFVMERWHKTYMAIQNISSVIPDKIHLYQNYPNPFNPTTNIEFDLNKSGNVTLKIYDQLGKEVSTLVDEFLSAGKFKVDFNGSNLTSGVYYYSLRTNDFVETKKFILSK